MIDIDKVYNADCLEGMKAIDDGVVDFVLTDLPYGVLDPQSEWDRTPPLENLRDEFLRVIKSNGAICLFSSGRFTLDLGTVFRDYFKYKFVWHKQSVSGFINCKYRPLTAHEDILIFSKGTAAPRASNNMTYNPQGLIEYNRKGTDSKKKKAPLWVRVLVTQIIKITYANISIIRVMFWNLMRWQQNACTLRKNQLTCWSI